jgi:hypothetical protein
MIRNISIKLAVITIILGSNALLAMNGQSPNKQNPFAGMFGLPIGNSAQPSQGNLIIGPNTAQMQLPPISEKGENGSGPNSASNSAAGPEAPTSQITQINPAQQTNSQAVPERASQPRKRRKTLGDAREVIPGYIPFSAREQKPNMSQTGPSHTRRLSSISGNDKIFLAGIMPEDADRELQSPSPTPRRALHSRSRSYSADDIRGMVIAKGGVAWTIKDQANPGNVSALSPQSTKTSQESPKVGQRERLLSAGRQAQVSPRPESPSMSPKTPNSARRKSFINPDDRPIVSGMSISPQLGRSADNVQQPHSAPQSPEKSPDQRKFLRASIKQVNVEQRKQAPANNANSGAPFLPRSQSLSDAHVMYSEFSNQPGLSPCLKKRSLAISPVDKKVQFERTFKIEDIYQKNAHRIKRAQSMSALGNVIQFGNESEEESISRQYRNNALTKIKQLQSLMSDIQFTPIWQEVQTSITGMLDLARLVSQNDRRRTKLMMTQMDRTFTSFIQDRTALSQQQAGFNKQLIANAQQTWTGFMDRFRKEFADQSQVEGQPSLPVNPPSPTHSSDDRNQ